MRLKAAHRISIRQGDAKGYYSPWQKVQALLDWRNLYPSNREGILSEDIPIRQERYQQMTHILIYEESEGAGSAKEGPP
jgi:hypothetical protein